MSNIRFEKVGDNETIASLKTQWQASLTFPHDSFDDSIIDSSEHWGIYLEEKVIGYACVSQKITLRQFYILPKFLNYGAKALEQFIQQNEIQQAIVGTNNPICMSLVMQFQQSTEIESYLFKNVEEVTQEERAADFRLAKVEELDQILDFADKAYGSEEVSESRQEWLNEYYLDCLKQDIIFVLEKDNEYIGVLEVRTSTTPPAKTTFGITVSPDYRNQGYGSYILVKGKSIAKSRESQAICGCNAKNASSRRAIEKSGFRVMHLLLLVKLKA